MIRRDPQLDVLELDPAFTAELEQHFREAHVTTSGTEWDAAAFLQVVHFETQSGLCAYVSGQLELAGVDVRAWLSDLLWRASLVAHWRWRLEDGRALTYGRKFAPPPARAWGCAVGAPCLGCVACQHKLMMT